MNPNQNAPEDNQGPAGGGFGQPQVITPQQIANSQPDQPSSFSPSPQAVNQNDNSLAQPSHQAGGQGSPSASGGPQQPITQLNVHQQPAAANTEPAQDTSVAGASASADLQNQAAVMANSPEAHPVSQTPAANKAASGETTKPKKKGPVKLILAVITVLIAMGIGGGAFAYMQIVNNSPEKVLADAMANSAQGLFEDRPFKISGNIDYDINDGGELEKMNIEYEGFYVNDDTQLDASMRLQGGSVDFTVSGSVIVELNDDGFVMYAKFDNLLNTVNQILRSSGDPMLRLGFSQFSPLIQKIDGKWVKFDQKTMEELGISSPDLKLSECLDATHSLKLSDSEMQQIKNLYKDNQFLKVTEEMPEESVNGVESYHYKLEFESGPGERFEEGLMKIDSIKKVEEVCGTAMEDLLDTEGTASGDVEVTDSTEVTSAEIWISKSDRVPTKLQVSAKDKDVTIDFVGSPEFNAEDVNIEIPESSMSPEEFVQEIESFLIGGSTLGWFDDRQIAQ